MDVICVTLPQITIVTHVYLWQIHFDIWQNQYNIVKLNKVKFKKKMLVKKKRSLIVNHQIKYNSNEEFEISQELPKCNIEI